MDPPEDASEVDEASDDRESLIQDDIIYVGEDEDEQEARDAARQARIERALDDKIERCER